jgi:hypothetical protein
LLLISFALVAIVNKPQEADDRLMQGRALQPVNA